MLLSETEMRSLRFVRFSLLSFCIILVIKIPTANVRRLCARLPTAQVMDGGRLQQLLNLMQYWELNE
jgi:hypothetical protein